MSWFINLKMRVKLFLSFGLVLLIMTVIILYAYKNILDLQKSQQKLFEKNFNNAVDLINFKANTTKQRSNLVSILATVDKKYEKDLEKERQDLKIENTSLVKSLYDRNADDRAFIAKMEEIDKIRTASNQFHIETVLPLLEKEQNQQASDYIFGVQRERYRTIMDLCDKLRETVAKETANDLEKNKEKIQTFSFVFMLAALIALAITVAITMFLNRIISEPLQELSEAAEKIAQGDLDVHVANQKREDEVGLLVNVFNQMFMSIKETSYIAKEIEVGRLSVNVRPKSENDVLLNSFAGMVNNLKKMAEVAQRIAKGDLGSNIDPYEGDVLANAFKTMNDNLRKIISEIQDVSEFLVSTSSEISASTSQLSAGMVETATSINQTTATVEEVKQTAQISSQKAKYVVEIAQKTAQVSQSGKKAVDDSMSSMEDIRKQMDFVTDSVIRLSEQTQAISDIISTIDGLAEQSNLLAVNAAIEAAKANEHGRGFSVVAQEVRKLAEQSRQATAQVRGILNNIQKATNTAVMTAEQGNKSVEEGMKKSEITKDAIQTLSSSIIEAAQASTQISASAHQQLIGMEQIASAMENIKQASIQNATSTKQVDNSMENLRKTNQNLLSLLNTYKL